MLRYVAVLAMVAAFVTGMACGDGTPGAPSGGTAGGGVTGGGGGAGAGGSGEPATCTGSYFPWKEGNSWTYNVVDPTGQVTNYTKTQTVGALEAVGGRCPAVAAEMAYKTTSVMTKGLQTDMTVSWQKYLDTSKTLVRYRELSFMTGTTTVTVEDCWTPYKLRLDEAAAHVLADATYMETYQETKSLAGGVSMTREVVETWLVEGVDVPCGIAPCGPDKGKNLKCLRLKNQTVGSTTPAKSYLFAQCIGKIAEAGVQSEKLIDCSLR